LLLRSRGFAAVSPRRLPRIALLAALGLVDLACGKRRAHGGGSGDAGAIAHPQPIHDGDAVFFVGNSFFGWEDRWLPDWVAALGEATTPQVHIKVGSDIVFGNTPLGQFLKHPKVAAALASRKYKVFVLQAEEFEPVDHKAAFQTAVREFNRAVQAAGARTLLFMTWEFRWRHFLDDLAESYEEIGAELGIPVIPVGRIYRDCDRAPYGGRSPYWLTGGDLHPTAEGAAVEAFATFEMLTGINPHGVKLHVAGSPNDDAFFSYVSDVTWARVKPLL